MSRVKLEKMESNRPLLNLMKCDSCKCLSMTLKAVKKYKTLISSSLNYKHVEPALYNFAFLSVLSALLLVLRMKPLLKVF